MNDPQLDLDWQSFRYVSDEMSEAEVSRFEALLGEQQAAREAVADAVALMYALDRLRPSPEVASPRRVHRGWMQPAVWLTAAAACLLAVFLAVQSVRHDPHVPGVEAAEMDSLARAWTSTALSDTTGPLPNHSGESDLEFPETIAVFESDEPIAVLSSEEDETTLAPPQWMMAAVRTDVDPEAENDL